MSPAFALAAFVASLVSVRAFLEFSRRRLLAQPGERSSHVRPTPTGGGFPAVIVFVLVAGAAIGAGQLSGGMRWYAAAACALSMTLVGLLDDALDLSPRVRLGVQCALGVLVVLTVGSPRAGALTPLLALASVIFVVGLINSFNFMDGIDALVGGTGAVIALSLALFTGDPLWTLLAASYAGFLWFNLPPARIFMGDAGSTALGGLVAIAFLSGRAGLAPRHLLILLPLIGDSAYTIARRLLRRENIARAHHSHLYQRLLRAGHRHGPISAGYAAATAAVALLVYYGGDLGAACALLVWGLGVVAVERYLSLRSVPFTRPANASLPKP